MNGTSWCSTQERCAHKGSEDREGSSEQNLAPIPALKITALRASPGFIADGVERFKELTDGQLAKQAHRLLCAAQSGIRMVTAAGWCR